MRFCLCCFFSWLLLPHAGLNPCHLNWPLACSYAADAMGVQQLHYYLLQQGENLEPFLSLNCCGGRSKSVTSPCSSMVPRCKINEALGYAQFLLVGGKYDETGALAWGSVLSAESAGISHPCCVYKARRRNGEGRVFECPWTKETSSRAWSGALTCAGSSEGDLSLPSCCRNLWKS